MLVGFGLDKWHALVGVALAVTTGACRPGGDGSSGPDPSGRLGYAAFRWDCAGEGDLGCAVGEAFPRGVAVGSVYEVRASATSRAPDSISVDRVQQTAAIRAGLHAIDGLQAVEPGLVTLMALSTDGELVDYTTIDQRRVQGFDLRRASDSVYPPSCEPGSDCFEEITEEPAEPPEFVEGAITSVRVEPKDGMGERLMGHLEYAWTVRPESVAVLGADATGSRVDIDVLSEGMFEIEVRAAGRTAIFTFGAASAGPTRRRPGTGQTGTGGETEGEGTGTEGTTTGETEGSGSSTGGEQ